MISRTSPIKRVSAFLPLQMRECDVTHDLDVSISIEVVDQAANTGNAALHAARNDAAYDISRIGGLGLQNPYSRSEEIEKSDNQASEADGAKRVCHCAAVSGLQLSSRSGA